MGKNSGLASVSHSAIRDYLNGTNLPIVCLEYTCTETALSPLGTRVQVVLEIIVRDRSSWR